MVAVLGDEGMDPSLQAPSEADAVRRQSARVADGELPPEEVAVIVERSDGQARVSRQQQRDLVLRFRAQLEIRLRRRVPGDEERVARGADLAVQPVRFEERTELRDAPPPLLQHLLPVAEEDELTHREVPEPP